MLSIEGYGWKSLRTSYPPGGVEVFERETAEGDGFALGAKEGKMIVAAGVVVKWETCFWFSTAKNRLASIPLTLFVRTQWVGSGKCFLRDH